MIAGKSIKNFCRKVKVYSRAGNEFYARVTKWSRALQSLKIGANDIKLTVCIRERRYYLA